ncbi:hypothetical protein NEOLEDRAFT_1145911 [Neolentinus lepideus HHB14362 ss-1]|uniref:P-loop containing nucleoside triphosphate hydrolase protein n=1 Tax=Neolentinus lepideus HHB14362 ss-1 TaxID=1314782 RepID=A0A165UK94_9AGAM|nr:hypothetical protein NEOLEDRAFT_1145911 [Neolentinus lepideus HHB14362 ss-1]
MIHTFIRTFDTRVNRSTEGHGTLDVIIASKRMSETLWEDSLAYPVYAALCSSVALLGLAVATYFTGNGSDLSLEHPESSDSEWLQFAHCLTYGYTTMLALLSVSLTNSWSQVAMRHFVLVMLSSFVVYAWRDLYPLATYNRTPVNGAEGWILWATIALLGLAAVVIPVVTPRQYVPFDPEDSKEPTPEQTASILSFYIFSFMDPVVSAAGKVNHLPYTRLPPLADSDDSNNLVKESFPYLDPVSPTKSRHIFWGLIRVFWKATLLPNLHWEHILECVMLIVKCLTLYISPYSIGQLLKHIEGGGANATVIPWFWIAALFCGPAIGSIAVQSFTYLTNVIAVRTEAIITALVSEHSLRIRIKAKSGFDTGSADGSGSPDTQENSQILGKINNLVTSDLNNITDGRNFLLLGLYSPLQVVLSIWFLYSILERSAFVGMAIMILLFPLPGYIAKKLYGIQVEAMKMADVRVGAVTEILSVLRMIKLFGWERKMGERLAAKREEELKWIFRCQMLWLLNVTINYLIPLFYMMATYITYTVIMHRSLSASIVFPSMTVFEMLRLQLFTVFHWAPVYIQVRQTELIDLFSCSGDESTVTPVQAPDSDVIGFHDAKFTWTRSSSGDSASPAQRRFQLAIDDLYFEEGQINLIFGPTGSGKTFMLMALPGEMHFIPASPGGWFNLPRGDGVAYVPQESWVLNDTIKNNILFGAPYDTERYIQVVHQCCLQRDLELFDAGDDTEVGEKGVTLSGGQKVLAALDVHTSKWIVDKCFKGALIRGRTVLLVTQNLPLAASVAKFAVSMNTDGHILAQGLASKVVGRGATELKTTGSIRSQYEPSESNNSAKEVSGKLIADEELAEGRVGWSSLQVWFLGYWAQQYDTQPAEAVSVPWYLTVYCVLLGLSAVASYISHRAYFLGSIRASRVMHQQLMQSIIGTTLRWLDQTPTSRIMTRCTQDIRTLDGPLAMLTLDFGDSVASMLMKFVAISVLTPAFILPGVLAVIFGSRLSQMFLRAQLAIKREMSAARAPVLGHFTAAIEDIVSIRAYRTQIMYRRHLFARINRYTRVTRSLHNLNLWIGLRMDFLGALLTSTLAAYLVYWKQVPTASNAGFSLNMAVAFSGLILWAVIQFNEFQVQGLYSGNSLERIQQYLRIEQEPEVTNSRVPPAYWPSSGDLRVEHLHARYSPDGPDVLHDISFHAKPGQRVGIVGRTGSGKSSLMLSLLRCIITSGDVYYDGIRTDLLNLDNLRSNMTIIPQDPELLSGSLRQNLDPFSEHDDTTLYDALRDAGLSNIQTKNSNNNITLDTEIASGGKNLSIGQRQILALARALIRRSKLLFLDEATSAIGRKWATCSLITAEKKRIPHSSG